MAEIELIDGVFLFLYSKQNGVISYKSIETIEQDMMTAIRRLNTIYECGFSSRENNQQQTMSHNQTIYNYSINSKGIAFVESLPDGFKDKPYSYYVKLDTDRQNLQNERDEIDYKVKKITLKSIPTNKNIALWSLLVAITAIVAPIIVNKMGENKTIKTESTLPQLNKIQETQEQALQVLKDILDSFRKK